MYESSDSYRQDVKIRRKGINPSIAWRPTAQTRVVAAYEHFEDDRVADRGIPSYRGLPVATDRSTFFGDPHNSPTDTELDAVSLHVEHRFASGLGLSNRTRWSDQDKFYQNVFPGAVNAAGTGVSIAAYNNATQRKSLFNQTDLTLDVHTGGVKHTLLGGLELSKQDTDNARLTGFFPGDETSELVPLGNPRPTLPIVFRQSATDADNSGTAKTVGLYVQDQIELSPSLQLIAGLRFDRFEVDFRNNRNGDRFETKDDLVSPRVGVVYKPMPALSLYANYSLAHLPRAGEQLSSLSLNNSALAPEKFKNYELGAKWDVGSSLAATAAVFRLDRTNVVVLDPADPTGATTMLSDGQRIEGLELGVTGNVTSAWSVAGGYAYTRAKFTADTSATLREGARVGQVPRQSFALWNRYDFTPMWGAGLGVIHRSRMFATNQLIATTASPIPNVELAGYTRFDAAVFATLSRQLRLQLNVENLFDKHYYLNAHSNNNITPGSPRAFRVTLNATY